MGAEESDDSGAPVGTVRVDDFGAMSIDSNAGWAESGRDGMAFFRAAIASLRAERPAPGPLAGFAGEAVAFWAAFGFDGSFSKRVLDLLSRVAIIL